jgi:hypothetical protein
VFMHLVQPQDDPDAWVMLEMFRSAPRGTSICASPTTPRATRFSKVSCASPPTFACSTRNRKREANDSVFSSDDLEPMTESG